MSEPLLSMREAAKELGLVESRGENAGQFLRRYLLRREQETGHTILVRNGRRYYVTLAKVRRFAPELADRADQVEVALRAMMRNNDRRLREILDRLDDQRTELSVMAEILRQIQRFLRIRR